MDIEPLRTAVFAKQRVLARIYNSAGQLSLADYVSSWRVGPGNHSAEALLFFDQIKTIAAVLYGPDVAAGVLSQLLARPLVSTVDHHGIFGHPFFLNSNLIYSLYPEQKFLVCLPTAGVSLNNNTSWSGCLLLNGDDGKLRRFSFFPDKLKTHTVLSAPVLTRADGQRVVARILAADFLTPDKKQRLTGLIQELFFDPGLLSLPDFSSQAAVVSRRLWHKVFPEAPELIYLPLETLVTRQLVAIAAGAPGHVLYRLLFTPAGWQEVDRQFSGSLGAFSGAHKGSFLFWGLKANGRRAHLLRRGNHLVDHGFSIAAGAAAVAQGLQSGQLYPTSLVCFLVLLYYQLTCVGGFNQVNWLTHIQGKFVELLKNLGERDLAGQAAAAVTDNFAEANLAFALGQEGRIYQPTLLDLFLDGRVDSYHNYRRLAQDLSLGDSLDSQLPEIYKVVTPVLARKPELSAIRESTIISRNGLAELLRRHLVQQD